MNNDEYFNLMREAEACSHEAAKNFLKEYLNGPFAQELSLEKEIFLNNQDFKAGLLTQLFYQLKKIDFWDYIKDSDWDNLCDLTMLHAFEYFASLRN